MRVNRRSALRALIAAWTSSARLPVGAQELPDPAWLLSGGVTDSWAVVKAAFVDRPAPQPRLLVSTQRDLSNAAAVEGRWSPAPSATYSQRLISEFNIHDLQPATEDFAGFRAGTGTLARFRTFGRGAFNFVAAFASCAGGTRVVPLASKTC